MSIIAVFHGRGTTYTGSAPFRWAQGDLLPWLNQMLQDPTIDGIAFITGQASAYNDIVARAFEISISVVPGIAGTPWLNSVARGENLSTSRPVT